MILPSVGGSIWPDGTYSYVWGIELITNGTVYYVYNARGDVVQLLNASGTLTKTYDYDAYGNELSRDLNDANPFRYCGEYYDTETGFIYLRARYYDPNVGRFISVDPAHDGWNWYEYCGDNPINYFDPSGLRAHKRLVKYNEGVTYNREAAIEYASRYYLFGNPDEMRLNGLYGIQYGLMYHVRWGSDCANFVSQCLDAGGIRQNDNWVLL